MNIYTFKTTNDMEPFMEWLNVNVGKRYRIIRLTRPRRPVFAKKKVFHSQVICRKKYPRDGGWSQCHYSAVSFARERQFSSRVADDERPSFYKRRNFRSRFLRRRALAYFRRHGINKTLSVISVKFDSAADMVLCKMLWHDQR